MGWGKWFRDGSESVKEKTEKTRHGTEKHTLRSTGGSKSNHSHVIVKEKASGGKTAHGAGPKHNR